MKTVTVGYWTLVISACMLMLSSCSLALKILIVNNSGAEITVHSSGQQETIPQGGSADVVYPASTYGYVMQVESKSLSCSLHYHFPHRPPLPQPHTPYGEPIPLQLEPDGTLYLLPLESDTPLSASELARTQAAPFPLVPQKMRCESSAT